MDIIGSRDTLKIVERTLSRVDPRLLDHGSRVAYLVYRLLSRAEDLSPHERVNRVVAALLHDVGAYKTEDIDRMVVFETDTVWEHSIYGYLFLKNLSPLEDYARAVLFHHRPYYLLTGEDERTQELASLILLADRIDILHLSGVSLFPYIERQRGKLFSPQWVDRFRQAEREEGLMEALKTGAYRDSLNELFKTADFTPEERRKFLQMVAFSIDFRSEYTVLHTVTTVSLSVEIGRMLGEPDDELDSLYYGALLHDVGKVSTPIAILEKPGRLTPEEMTVMRRHVEVSDEILADLVSPCIRRIAVRHHEKLDGSGYPWGLTCDHLSTDERIVAIADILSALIRKRSYKDAYDKERVRAILTGMKADGLLCPVLVDLVLNRYDELTAAAAQNSREILGLYTSLRGEYERLLAQVRRREEREALPL